MNLVEAERATENVELLLNPHTEVNLVMFSDNQEHATLNHAQLIASLEIGQNGTHALSLAEEANKNEADPSPPHQQTEELYAHSLKKSVIATSYLAQLTVFWQTGPNGLNVMSLVVEDTKTEPEPSPLHQLTEAKTVKPQPKPKPATLNHAQSTV